MARRVRARKPRPARARHLWPERSSPGSRRLHVAVAGPALAAAALVHLVGVEHLPRRNRILLRQSRVDRREIRPCRLHQLLETIDHEIGLLVAVDAIARAHGPLEVETDAVGLIGLQRMQRLALDRKRTRLNFSYSCQSRMRSAAGNKTKN